MTTTLLREKTEEAVATEMNVATALVHVDGVLRGLHLNRRNEMMPKSVMVPVAMLKEMAVFLMDYRRTLETAQATLPLAHFKTLTDRNAALDAYQNVCQQAMRLLCQVDAAAQ